MDIVIRNGTLITPSGVFPADVGIVGERIVALGNTSPIFHALTRPPRQEAEAVSRAIDVAALARNSLYIVHVSCEESMSRIQAARVRGEDVHGETCPQYLLLNEMALDLPGGERLVCSPPLRTEEDNEALWGGLAFAPTRPASLACTARGRLRPALTLTW